MKRVGRFRERQYQLAAQKHNQEFLKYDYYQQIAKYFERECRIAKHYDSWNYRNLDPKGELEKAKKAERLQARRNKLRNLLKEEDETYRRELEERKRVKNRAEGSSLEVLKQKLREQRAEQSLYLPRTCRRYQSYFVYPKELSSPSTLRDTNLQHSRACRDSTNFLHQARQTSHRGSWKMSGESGASSQEQENAGQMEDPRHSSSSVAVGRPSSRYSARYARRSLENTNVRCDDSVDYPSSRAASKSSLGFGSCDRHTLSNGEILRGEGGENRAEQDAKTGNPQNGEVTGNASSSCTEADANVAKDPPPREIPLDVPRERSDENADSKRHSTDRLSESVDTHRCESSVDKRNAEVQDAKTKDTRQFEVEKSFPWLRINPSDKNLSKQMFLYLTYKELKRNIVDLDKRETHARNKQYWDEALRLRDMRNKLELIRERKLYNMELLDLDEKSRQLGLDNIDKREAELVEREKICMDSTMYSEDAKAMWIKWMYEDDRSVIKDALLQRERLMYRLEKEWQNLAMREKERISRNYQSVLNDSALQEEHKLSAAINATRVKSVTSSLK